MTCSASLKGRFGGYVENRFQNKKKCQFGVYSRNPDDRVPFIKVIRGILIKSESDWQVTSMFIIWL